MYNVIRQKLRPTPLHPHFLFTQHELSRVVQGMSLLSSKSRGRPRPRGRRRTEIGTETEHQTKTGPVPAAKSDQIRSREQGQGKERIWKGRRWGLHPHSFCHLACLPASISISLDRRRYENDWNPNFLSAQMYFLRLNTSAIQLVTCLNLVNFLAVSYRYQETSQQRDELE